MWFDILDRQKIVEIAYQKGKELNLNNKTYLEWLNSFFSKEYSDDVGAGDITSKAILKKNERRIAFLNVKTSGVIAGVEEVSYFLKKHHLNVKTYQKDGEEALKGKTVLEIKGKQKDILATERIASKCFAENVRNSHRNKKLN